MFDLLIIIFGFLIGVLIHKMIYHDKRPHGPDSNKIKRMTFFDETTKKCYKYEPKITFCPTSNL